MVAPASGRKDLFPSYTLEQIDGLILKYRTVYPLRKHSQTKLYMEAGRRAGVKICAVSYGYGKREDLVLGLTAETQRRREKLLTSRPPFSGKGLMG